MASSVKPASSARASNRRPKAADSLFTPSIARQLPQLGADLGVALDHRVPHHLVGARDEFLSLFRPKVDRLDAGPGLALELGLVVGVVLAVEPLEPQCR